VIVPAVTLIALAVLFFLTSLALYASDRLRHPVPTLLALAAALLLGLTFALG
jgi:hypothetical protein